MALNEQELIETYRGLMNAFPADLHIARPLIQLLQTRGEKKEARELSMMMARRMLSLGYSRYALAFISICEQLEHPDIEKIDSIKTMAELTIDALPHGETAQVFALIEELSDAEAQDFLKQGNLLHIPEGRDIVKQGDISHSFYLILEGTMRVHMDTSTGHDIGLNTLEKGNFFGEFACVYQLPRTATVTAATQAKILKFQGSAIAELIDASPEAGDGLMRIIQRRLIASVSYAHPVFSAIEAADRVWLEEDAELVEYAAGDVIDEAGEFFFILAFGQALATREVAGQTLTCELGVNAVYGNANDVLALPAQTKLVASERCLVCKVPLEIFTAFSIAYVGFEGWVESHVAQRNEKLQPV